MTKGRVMPRKKDRKVFRSLAGKVKKINKVTHQVGGTRL